MKKNSAIPLSNFLSDTFLNSIFAGIESEIEKNAYRLMFALYKGENILNSSVQQMIQGNIVDGIILYGTVNIQLINKLIQSRIKFVLIDYFIKNIKTHSILPDNFNGSYQATKYLLHKNLTKIYCINGKYNHPSYIERPAGYRKALKEAGIKPVIYKTDASIGDTYSFIKNLIKKNDLPEAFFATGDNMAVGILRCLLDHNIKVPSQIKVIGFDNVLWAANEKIKLTTVNVPKIKMGSEAVKLLLKLLDNNIKPSIHRLATELIIKESA